MTDTSLLFTVLTPTYNRASTLPRVYESLCRQTCRHFEWLIIDDGSTDTTQAVVQAWQADADFPIRYLWQNNQHKKTAFNHGVREAQGQFIVALDSDDAMPADALMIFKQAWADIPPDRRDTYIGITGLCARPNGAVVGDRYPRDIFDSTAIDIYFRYRIRGEKFGCMRTDVLRQFPFPETVSGFVPESLVWWAIARAGYLSRFINQVVRFYHESPDGLTQGAVSIQNNAQGLYLLAWDMLQHHLAFFRYRPREFLLTAARYTRFRLHLKDAGIPLATQTYRLTQPLARALVAVLSPIGYALYWRDRQRGRQ